MKTQLMEMYQISSLILKKFKKRLKSQFKEQSLLLTQVDPKIWQSSQTQILKEQILQNIPLKQDPQNPKKFSIELMFKLMLNYLSENKNHQKIFSFQAVLFLFYQKVKQKSEHLEQWLYGSLGQISTKLKSIKIIQESDTKGFKCIMTQGQSLRKQWSIDQEIRVRLQIIITLNFLFLSFSDESSVRIFRLIDQALFLNKNLNINILAPSIFMCIQGKADGIYLAQQDHKLVIDEIMYHQMEFITIDEDLSPDQYYKIKLTNYDIKCQNKTKSYLQYLQEFSNIKNIILIVNMEHINYIDFLKIYSYLSQIKLVFYYGKNRYHYRVYGNKFYQISQQKQEGTEQIKEELKKIYLNKSENTSFPNFSYFNCDDKSGICLKLIFNIRALKWIISGYDHQSCKKAFRSFLIKEGTRQRLQFQSDQLTISELIQSIDKNTFREKLVFYYTLQSPVYRIINRVLRSFNKIEYLPHFKYLCGALYKQIQSLYLKEQQPIGKFYRCCYLTNAEFQYLTKPCNIGKFIMLEGISSFSHQPNPSFGQHCLIVEVDEHIKSENIGGYADISKISSKKGQKQVIFNFLNYFQIIGVSQKLQYKQDEIKQKYEYFNGCFENIIKLKLVIPSQLLEKQKLTDDERSFLDIYKSQNKSYKSQISLFRQMNMQDYYLKARIQQYYAYAEMFKQYPNILENTIKIEGLQILDSFRKYIKQKYKNRQFSDNFFYLVVLELIYEQKIQRCILYIFCKYNNLDEQFIQLFEQFKQNNPQLIQYIDCKFLQYYSDQAYFANKNNGLGISLHHVGIKQQIQKRQYTQLTNPQIFSQCKEYQKKINCMERWLHNWERLNQLSKDVLKFFSNIQQFCGIITISLTIFISTQQTVKLYKKYRKYLRFLATQHISWIKVSQTYRMVQIRIKIIEQNKKIPKNKQIEQNKKTEQLIKQIEKIKQKLKQIPKNKKTEQLSKQIEQTKQKLKQRPTNKQIEQLSKQVDLIIQDKIIRSNSYKQQHYFQKFNQNSINLMLKNKQEQIKKYKDPSIQFSNILNLQIKILDHQLFNYLTSEITSIQTWNLYYQNLFNLKVSQLVLKNYSQVSIILFNLSKSIQRPQIRKGVTLQKMLKLHRLNIVYGYPNYSKDLLLSFAQNYFTDQFFTNKLNQPQLIVHIFSELYKMGCLKLGFQRIYRYWQRITKTLQIKVAVIDAFISPNQLYKIKEIAQFMNKYEANYFQQSQKVFKKKYKANDFSLFQQVLKKKQQKAIENIQKLIQKFLNGNIEQTDKIYLKMFTQFIQIAGIQEYRFLLDLEQLIYTEPQFSGIAASYYIKACDFEYRFVIIKEWFPEHKQNLLQIFENLHIQFLIKQMQVLSLQQNQVPQKIKKYISSNLIKKCKQWGYSQCGKYLQNNFKYQHLLDKHLQDSQIIYQNCKEKIQQALSNNRQKLKQLIVKFISTQFSRMCRYSKYKYLLQFGQVLQEHKEHDLANLCLQVVLNQTFLVILCCKKNEINKIKRLLVYSKDQCPTYRDQFPMNYKQGHIFKIKEYLIDTMINYVIIYQDNNKDLQYLYNQMLNLITNEPTSTILKQYQKDQKINRQKCLEYILKVQGYFEQFFNIKQAIYQKKEELWLNRQIMQQDQN